MRYLQSNADPMPEKYRKRKAQQNDDEDEQPSTDSEADYTRRQDVSVTNSGEASHYPQPLSATLPGCVGVAVGAATSGPSQLKNVSSPNVGRPAREGA